MLEGEKGWEGGGKRQKWEGGGREGSEERRMQCLIDLVTHLWDLVC